MRSLTCGVAASLLALGLGSVAQAGNHPKIVGEPGGITLVGHTGVVPDPLGTMTFTVVDYFIGDPYVGGVVTLDFTHCGDVKIYSDVVADGLYLDCRWPWVSAVTDIQGRVRFTVVGAGTGGTTNAGPCAKVTVDGRGSDPAGPFAPLTVSAFDLDGAGGVNGLDISIAAGDLFSHQYRARSDFDFDGDVDGIDLGILYRAMLSGGSSASGAVACTP